MNFKPGDKVETNRIIYAGIQENGNYVCGKNIKGIVTQVQHRECDGINVKLESGIAWWFKPSQLIILN